jgi:hypothetical protein
MHSGLALALLLASAPLGRLLELWPYDKLFQRADLVVIATAVSTVDAPANIKDQAPEDHLKGVCTTFRVAHVVKGAHRGKELTVFHYRLALKEGQGIVNGPSLVRFHSGRLNLSYPGGFASLPPPEYLLFLKKRPDGRFECVSGQYDPDQSVKQITQPLSPCEGRQGDEGVNPLRKVDPALVEKAIRAIQKHEPPDKE